MTTGDIYDKVFDEVYLTIKANVPTVTIENTGIGSYEFWGAKGFDKGHDVAYVEDDNLDIAVDFPGIDVVLLNEVVETINEENYQSSFTADNYEISYAVKNAKVIDNKIIVEVVWVNVG